MAIHWKIPFKSLRTNTSYTVNIYDSTFSGTAIVLKGGAQPFTTQESDDDDMFTPIRTQTGYLRIVDDGLDANGNSWNWKTLLPSTDTDRPVTLTDGNGTVVWQGFMQSQNFGGVLYGNPQEREFPIQCPLSVLEGTDINYHHTEIENFAYLLQRIVNAIDVVSGGTEGGSVITSNGVIHIGNIYIQGNTDAQAWLLKRIDWQNFVDEDDEDTMTARFNLYQCLEDMCRFWGWTARTYQNNLYLTCADDSGEQLWLTLTRANLDTMAAGSSAGTTGGTFYNMQYFGDIFANNSQNDYMQRGPNKASVKAAAGTGDTNVDLNIKALIDSEHNRGWQAPFNNSKNERVLITNDLYSFSLPYLTGSTLSSVYGSFNRMNIGTTVGDSGSETSLIRIKKTSPANFGIGNDPYVSLESVYEHGFGDGYIQLTGDIYRKGDKFKAIEEERQSAGSKSMWMRLGIGKTRNTAYWWDSNTQGGGAWIGMTQPSVHYFKCTIGNIDNKLRVLTPGGTYSWIEKIPVDANISGKIFIDFLGSSDLDNISGEKSFDISDFELVFTRNEESLDYWGITKDERKNTRTYKSSNSNAVRNEFNADCIYASDNNMLFGYGVLMNPDGSYFKGFQYVEHGPLVYPEQHLANRVTTYWASAKRKLEVELRAGTIAEPSPMNKVTIDSTTGYPIAISHDWRDDITKLTILEL